MGGIEPNLPWEAGNDPNCPLSSFSIPWLGQFCHGFESKAKRSLREWEEEGNHSIPSAERGDPFLYLFFILLTPQSHAHFFPKLGRENPLLNPPKMPFSSQNARDGTLLALKQRRNQAGKGDNCKSQPASSRWLLLVGKETRGFH